MSYFQTFRQLISLPQRGARRIAGARRTLPSGHRSVALTFDDGPDPVFTPKILDILDEHGVRATFFMVGSRATRYPDLVRRVAEQGHAIGSHSATHPDMWTLSAYQAVVEYVTGRRMLESILGRPVRLLRPPKSSIVPTQAIAMRALPVDPWLWSIDPRDWEPGATATSIVEAVGRPSDGDVIVLHDGMERP
ncbi:MAG TPA: polysaccharide deacetylase family protein, partial [Acidimicrobiales bacterium]|nr:polysaccharide deacetylase family protein [Acidimicrobiales bacterium]